MCWAAQFTASHAMHSSSPLEQPYEAEFFIIYQWTQSSSWQYDGLTH